MEWLFAVGITVLVILASVLFPSYVGDGEGGDVPADSGVDCGGGDGGCD